MNEKEKIKEVKFSKKNAIAYSFGQIAVIAAFNTFNFLVFTFYYAVVGINVILISLGFFIWTFWNCINDPLMGYLSDRTHTKWGRRMPYIMISLLPLGLVMFLLFTPPISIGITDEYTNFIYFIVIIMVFELIYTIFSLNIYSLFPETFITSEERSKANIITQSIGIVAMIAAFIFPTLFIPDLSDPKYLPEYRIFGVAIAVFIIIGGLLFLKFSPKEKAEFQEEYKNAPSFVDSIKFSAKNKSFRFYVIVKLANWFVIGLQTTIMPLYGKFVLGIGEGESIFLTFLTGIMFFSAALFMNILWKPLVQKIGPRKGWLISMVIWILTMVPLMFIENLTQGLITFFFLGIGLSGSLYYADLVISDVIDEDELNSGNRREAGYYGVNFLFIRLSTVFIFLSISLVFTSVGWAVYEPENVTATVVFGLRALGFIIPTIALLCGIIALYKYPLDGERLIKIKAELQKLHEEKKSKI